jgi:hypothetical protein
MDRTTLGDSINHPALAYVEDNIDYLPDNQRKYLSRFIQGFHQNYNKLNGDKEHEYFRILMKEDYIRKLNVIREKGYPNTLINHLENFIIGKLKQKYYGF